MAEARSLPAVRPVYEAGGDVERVAAEVVAPADLLPSRDEFAVIEAIAAKAAASAFFAQTRTPERAIMQILAGREYGIGPWAALANMHVIEGKPTLSADAMAGLVKRWLRRQGGGGYFRIAETTAERCTVEWRRPEDPAPSRLTYTIEEARAAGLTGKDNWKRHPAAMLRARAKSAAARAGFEDVVAGLYDPDEVEDVGIRAVAASDADRPATPTAAFREVGAPTHDAPDDPDKRQLAVAALHAMVAERGAPDAHAALKRLQGPMHADDDGEERDPRCFASFGDAEIWTVEALRPFYRRVRDLPDADFRRLAGLADPPDTPDPAAAIRETVRLGGHTVDADTGEVVAPPTDREDELAEFRREARACRTLEAWKALAARAGDDEDRWLVLAAETMSAGTIDALRKLARQQKANTPAVEDAFNRRRRDVVGAVEAGTP